MEVPRMLQSNSNQSIYLSIHPSIYLSIYRSIQFESMDIGLCGVICLLRTTPYDIFCRMTMLVLSVAAACG